MVDLYTINDALSGLAADAGVQLSDEDLNELTHLVGEVLNIEDSDPATIFVYST